MRAVNFCFLRYGMHDNDNFNKLPTVEQRQKVGYIFRFTFLKGPMQIASKDLHSVKKVVMTLGCLHFGTGDCAILAQKLVELWVKKNKMTDRSCRSRASLNSPLSMLNFLFFYTHISTSFCASVAQSANM
jgi:hypothetical protein